MTSAQRFHDAINHRQPDRTPVDFGATAVTGMHVTCVAALRDYYGLEKRPVKVNEPFQMLGMIEPDLEEIVGTDVTGVGTRTNLYGFANENWKEWRLDNGLEVLVPGNFNVTTDAAGNKYIYPEGDTSVPPSGKMPANGFYFDAIIRQPDFEEEDLKAEDNLEEFKPVTDSDVAYFKGELEKARATGKGVMANFGGTGLGDIALVPGPFMKHPKGIRDVEEWYVSTVARRELLHEIYDRQTELAVKNFEKINAAAGELVDALYICGTDFGTQTGTFCSPDTFSELYMPYYKRMNDWIHAHTGWKTFKHCCGAIESFIPLFIEAGFDILNPVQCSAAGMEPGYLKQKYGRDIVFWGGGVDTQKTLPFGTPEDVRREVRERCGIFGKGGGFVFNAIHNVQAGTPVRNIAAMIEAVKEFEA